MEKSLRAKLALNREVIRELADGNLSGAAGGVTNACTGTETTPNICQTTFLNHLITPIIQLPTNPCVIPTHNGCISGAICNITYQPRC